MAKPRFIIPVRSSDSWISVSMADGRDSFAANDWGCTASAVMTVSKADCVLPPTRTCEGVDSCGNKIWRVTPAPAAPTVVLEGGADSTGRLMFLLNAAFVALGKGRLNAEVSVCGKIIPVMLQVFSQPLLVDYTKGSVTGTVQIGNLWGVTLASNCAVPPGWAPVNKDRALVGYGRTTPCGAFTSAFVTEDCTTVYLDPGPDCAGCTPSTI